MNSQLLLLKKLSEQGIEVRSYISGRLRLRVRQLRGDPELSSRMVHELSEVPGIKRVEVHSRSESVVVYIDRATLKIDANEQRLFAVMQHLFPSVSVELWHDLWGGTPRETTQST